jgi:hypothetical protein
MPRKELVISLGDNTLATKENPSDNPFHSKSS